MNDDRNTPELHDTYTASDMTAAPTLPFSDRTSARRTFTRLGVALAVLTVAAVVAQMALDFLLAALISGYLDSWWRVWVLSLVPLYGVGLPLVLLCLRGLGAAPHNTTYTDGLLMADKPAFTLRHFLLLSVIALGFMYIGSYIGNLLMSLLSALVGYSYANGLNSLVLDSPLWMTVLGTCVCAPIGEEFIFRKLLIDRTRRYGDGVSILFSALMFALFHGNLFQLFYAFTLGALAAYIYTRTGQLRWSIALHAVANFVGGVLIPRLASILPTDPEEMLTPTPLQGLVSLFLSAWVLGLIIAGLILFFKLKGRRKLSSGTAPIEVRACGGPLFANPGMIAALILMGLMLALSLIPPV